MNAGGIRFERDGQIAVLTLDRPARQNTLNDLMYEELDRISTELRRQLPRAIILTGAGEKAFSAGFDVNPDNPQSSALFQAIERRDRPGILAIIGRIRRAVDGLVALPVPVIAALNGLAFGGGAEIAVRCDLRVMDPGAVICFSEVKLGLMPDHGGAVALTRLLGPARAADLILTGRTIGAAEAFTLGLTDRVSASGAALEEAKSLARAIAQNGPRAVRHALKVIRRVGDMCLPEALEMETAEASDLIVSGECLHGVGAFLAKLPPEFPEPEQPELPQAPLL